MALFDPNRHYPLPPVNWQPDEARQAIAAIAAETITQLETTPLLSGHPMDDQAFGSDLYFGKAGVLWAIDYLQTVGAIESTFNVATHLDATLEQNRQRYPQFSPYPEQASYLFGELPLLLLQYKLSPSADKATEVFQDHPQERYPAHPRVNVGHRWIDAGGVFYAPVDPGTPLAGGVSNPGRPAIAGMANGLMVQVICGRLTCTAARNSGWAGAWFCQQHDAAAGGAIRYSAMKTYQDIATRAMTTLVQTAQVEAGKANWPAVYEAENRGQDLKLVQYCHGAPGMVTALASLPVWG